MEMSIAEWFLRAKKMNVHERTGKTHPPLLRTEDTKNWVKYKKDFFDPKMKSRDGRHHGIDTKHYSIWLKK